jgi:hypothetical protein
MNITNKYLFLVIGTIGLSYVIAISSGANEPIADNELGLTAKDCALQYCTEKDGMALWLTLVNDCVESPNPYFMVKKNFETTPSNYIIYGQVTRFVAGSICSMFGVLGLITGYILGSYKNKNEIKYTKISQDERLIEM